MKLVIECWRQSPDMTRADFSAALRDRCAARLTDQRHTPGVSRIVISERLVSAEIDGFAAGRGWAEAPDAIVSAWLDKTRNGAARVSAAAIDAVAGGDAPLADMRLVSALLTTEHVVFDETDGAASDRVKMIIQVFRRPDLDTDAFQARWRGPHGKLVKVEGSKLGFVRYVQSHGVATADAALFTATGNGRRPPDGMTEVWWDNEAALKRAFASEEAAVASAVLATDEMQFIDPPRITAFLAREIAIR